MVALVEPSADVSADALVVPVTDNSTAATSAATTTWTRDMRMMCFPLAPQNAAQPRVSQMADRARISMVQPSEIPLSGSR
jgi:hypothetical protein